MEPKMRKEISGEWFVKIWDGWKKLEGRLRMGEWKDVSVGDIITFFNTKDELDEDVPSEYNVCVTALLITDSFDRLVSIAGVENILPGKCSDQDAVDTYMDINIIKYKTVEKVRQLAKEHGVVGVYIEVLK
jgi:ASC-1-like (ASCH) protein